MFYHCQALESIPHLDTSKVTNMSNMFDSCNKLKSIPQLDTSKVTSMYYMFYYCQSLESIPHLDTSKVTDMNSMFYDCQALESIPQLDTSKVASMYRMFYNCAKLKSIPQLDTSKVTNMSMMFYDCQALESIPQLDTSNVANVGGFLGYSNIDTLTDLGGFKDLGKKSSISGINSDFLRWAPNLTHESLMNVINNLYDRKSNGLSTLTISFDTTNLNKLTDEEKAIATNKGWNLA
jgi:surface protein